MTCTACGTANPEAAKFCMSCGHSLEAACSACETSLPVGAKFCFNCGHEMVSGSTAAEPGVPAVEVTQTIAEQVRGVRGASGERRTITMMFCDVVGSTATAERLDPEEWTGIMRAALDAFIAPVERYGGTVARLLGDAILAYFGAPIAHEDDPQRALLAALAIREGTRDLVRQVTANHDTGFDVRIGINTGLVVVGEVGSDLYGEYAALGDAANVAARMEQTADPGTIRIAEPTYKLIAPLFETEDAGAITVKGREDPVPAYTVVRAKAAPGQVRGIEGLSSEMVGRAHEFGRLVHAYEEVVSGQGRIVSVMAEAGLGKSRLVEEFRAAVTADGTTTWVAGQAYSYEDSTPYVPVLNALEGWLAEAAPDATDLAGRFEAVLPGLLGADARAHLVYLRTLLGLEVADEDADLLAYLEPPMLRQRTFDAVGAVLRALAERGPTVFAVEDVHWADPTTLSLLESLLALPQEAPLLLLLVFRPRRDEASWSLHEIAGREYPHRYEALALQPLDGDEARTLVANLLRVEGLSEQLRELILDKAEGNPFFVEEVIRSLLDDGTIVPEGDRFVATTSLQDIQVPDTLAAVLTTRLDRLDPAARAVMQTASVLGRQFSHDLLDALIPAADLPAQLLDLQRRELLVERRQGAEVVYRFKHALTRDTAYGTLLRSVRRDLHRDVGTLLEQRHPERVHELARHFVEADEPLRALPYVLDAGDGAFGAFATDDALRYYRQAVELWVEGQDLALARRAYEGVGQTLLFTGDIEGVLATYDRYLEFAEEHDDDDARISAHNKSGMALIVGLGDIEAANQRFLQAKELAEACDSTIGLAEFHVGYCVLNTSAGKLDVAASHLDEAADIVFDLDAFHRNFALTHYANTLVWMGEFEEAVPAAARAREQIEADGDRLHLADLLLGEAMLLLLQGQPDLGQRSALESRRVATEIGSYYTEVLACWALGHTSLHRGDYDAAAEAWGHGAATAEAFGLLGLEAATTVGLAHVAHALGTVDGLEAPAYMTRAREKLASPTGQAFGNEAWAGMAQVHLLRNEIDAARDCLKEAREISSATIRTALPEVLLCGFGVAMACRLPDDAAKSLEEAAALIESTGMVLYRPRATAARGLLTLAGGDRGAAVGLFREAEADAEDMGLLPDLLLIRRGAAAALDAAGVAEDAAVFRTRLPDAVAAIGARLEDPDARRSWLRTQATVATH